MIVIGALVWLVLGFAYSVLVLGVGWGTIVTCRRRGFWSLPVTLLAAICGGLVLGPIGFVAIYVPFHTESGTLLKPRLTESMLLAYVVALAVGFVSVLCLRGLLELWHHGKRGKSGA